MGTMGSHENPYLLLCYHMTEMSECRITSIFINNTHGTLTKPVI